MIKDINHPVVLHKLSLLRDRKTKPKQFRDLVYEITLFLAANATSQLDLMTTKQFESPLGPFQGVKLKNSIGIFPIMRAGNGMVDGMLTVLPTARVYHLGLYREKSTLLPVEYYNKLPADCHLDTGFIIDPMIATAGTSIAAVNMLKDWGLQKIIFVSIMASQKGIELLHDAHPDIDIYVAAIDDELTVEGYIFPGVGDAGDRLFKTLH